MRGVKMLSSSNTEIVSALQALQQSNPDIQAVALARIEGRILESTTLSMAERVQVGSSSAALLAIATKMSNYMQLGDAKQMQVRGEAGSVLLLRAGTGAILAIITNGDMKLDALTVEANRLANRLAILV
jgi:predicted regulator of Ras-like GTPase activity (Roadblock/LC7/MglB family)